MNKIIEYFKNKNNKNLGIIVDSIENGKCNRCLNEDEDLFAYDGYGLYCRCCIDYGKSSEYRKIIRVEKEVKRKEHILTLDYELTDIQKEASNFACEVMRNYDTGFI